MAIRLKTSFKSSPNILYEIEIHDSEFIGAPVDFIAGGDGFILNYEAGDGRIYNPIMASQISIPIHIRDNNRTQIEDFLIDMTTGGDENRFTIVVYENGYNFWKGKIQPERTNIPDHYYTQITIQGNDGFGRLRSIPYTTSAGSNYTGWINVKDQLFNILEKLDLFTFGTGSNYSMGIMTDWRVGSEQGQIFEKIRFQADAFLDISSDGTILPISCHDALTQILNRFHLRIIQSQGIFMIQNFTYLAATGIGKNTEFYDSTGAWSYTGSGVTYNSAILQRLEGGSRTFREPGKSALVQYAFRDSIGGSNLLTEQIQRSVPFSIGDIPSGNGEAFLFQLKYVVEHQAGGIVPLLYNIRHEFFISRGSYYLSNAGGDMVWSTNNANRVIINSTHRIKDTTTSNFIEQISFLAAEVPVSGEVVITWNWDTVDWVDKTPVTPVGTDTLSILDNIAIILYAVGDTNEGTAITVAKNENSSGEQIEIDPLLIGDKPFLRSIGRLQYNDFSAGEWLNSDSNWGIGTNENLNIDRLLARELIAFQKSALLIWRRILRQPHSPASNINNEIILSASFTANKRIWILETFTPAIDRSGITYFNYSDSENSVGGLPGGITPPPPEPVETHERLHALDSADDHELIPIGSRGKYLWADIATGKITYVDIQPHNHTEFVLKTGDTMTGNFNIHRGGQVVTAFSMATQAAAAEIVELLQTTYMTTTGSGEVNIRAMFTTLGNPTIERNIAYTTVHPIRGTAITYGSEDYDKVYLSVKTALIAEAEYVFVNTYSDGVRKVLASAFGGGGGGTVTSVGLSAPAIFSVSGSPVTTAGTLGLTLATQSANRIFAGPASGTAAQPTFRTLVATDIPALPYDNYSHWRILVNGVVQRILKEGGTPTGTYYDGVNFEAGANITLTASSPVQGNLNIKIDANVTGGGGGTVTSVGLSAPSIFSVSGSPVTTAGTLGLTLATQVANRIFAGPASGFNAQPTFRALVAADIPALPYDNYVNFRVAADGGPTAYISKAGGTTGSPYYDGIQFISGPGILVTPASGLGGFLNIEIEATGGGSGLANDALTSVLGTDIAITSSSTWTNSGLTLSFPADGDYLVLAQVTLKRQTTAAIGILAARLMNSLTTFASAEQQHESATTQRTALHLHAIITVGKGQPSAVALQVWASTTGWSVAANTPSSSVAAATILSVIRLT